MEGRMLQRTLIAVTAAYAAQGLGYAVVVTSLPALKARQSVDDLMVTLIVLGVCVFAAGGSFLANAVAVRAGSRPALALGLGLQAVALVAIAVPTPLVVFLAAFAIYGVGLGCVDAASAMQGVLVQRAHGAPLLGRFFGFYTVGAIAGAAWVSGAAGAAGDATVVRAGVTLGVAAVVALGVALAGLRLFAAERPVEEAASRSPGRLPVRGIWVFGAVILVAFVADSAVSTWSTVYLGDGLGAASWLAPLGYAAYQVVVLLTRFAADPLVRVAGPRVPVVFAIVVAAAGCVLVAVAPTPAAAIVGFALAGASTGLLVPLAFTGAGELDPERSDEIVARVNVFNYVGAVAGAVAVGALADGPGLAVGFLIPGVCLLGLLALVRAFRPARAGSAPAAR
jgi:MFS family permease